MKTASVREIKQELLKRDPSELVDACLRLARFKADNKGLLTYMLFLSDDEEAYIDYLCQTIDEHFKSTPRAQKKTVRKIIRWMDKCLRFTGDKETEIQVRLHFCDSLRKSETPVLASRVMTNMYTGQLKKSGKAIEKFHDDLKSEYQQHIDRLTPGN